MVERKKREIRKRELKLKKNLSLFQIFFLILGTVAISYSLGSSHLGIVSAQEAGRLCIEYKGSVFKARIETDPVIFDCEKNCGGLRIIDGDAMCNGEPTLCDDKGVLEGEHFKSCESLLGTGLSGPSNTNPSDFNLPSWIPNPVSMEGVAQRNVDLAFDRAFQNAIDGDDENNEESTTDETEEEKEGVDEKDVLTATAISTKRFVLGILANAAVTATLYVYGENFLESKGVSPGLSRAIGRGTAVAYGTKQVLLPLLDKLGLVSFGGPAAWLISLGAGIIWGLISYKKTKYKAIGFSCYPWSPPKGGNDCDQCNRNELGCSEYQCRSLGAGCELVNPGTNEELCTWVNRNDITPPVIQPWSDILSPDYNYNPDNTISPPDRGVKIVRQGSSLGNNCVEAFFSLQFGVTSNEPAKCKIDTVRKDSYESMLNFFASGSTYKFNHSQTLSLPSPSALAAENITLINGGEMDFFVRCEDRNGNSNVATFSFNFCVDDGPDTTPPLIVDTSILNGFPIGFDQTSVDLDIHVNEPSECRWDKLDRNYDDMENQMTCSTSVLNQNAQQLYQCSTTLTGMKNKVDNDFYFRCKDQPHLIGAENENERNENTQSHKFTLIGTQPLVISSLKPNNTIIRDSTDVIKITLEAETSAGYKEGEAICSFSDSGVAGSYIEYFNTNSFKHDQDLFLTEGDYTYHTRCVDLGGNADEGIIDFTVESDNDAPVVVRVYHEEQNLKIITNEDSECVYSNSECNYLFDDGIAMNSISDREHFTEWDVNQDFYIKCRDEFLNEPLPNECNIIARPFEIA